MFSKLYERFYQCISVREMFFFNMFLIRRPLVLRFEKKTFVFANGEDILFASYRKPNMLFKSYLITHKSQWSIGTSHRF